MVDQFVVKALLDVNGLEQASRLRRMQPEALTTGDAVVLIGILRAKAEVLNDKFGTESWTPRRIDMVLWTYGHP